MSEMYGKYLTNLPKSRLERALTDANLLEEDQEKWQRCCVCLAQTLINHMVKTKKIQLVGQVSHLWLLIDLPEIKKDFDQYFIGVLDEIFFVFVQKQEVSEEFGEIVYAASHEFLVYLCDLVGIEGYESIVDKLPNNPNKK